MSLKDYNWLYILPFLSLSLSLSVFHLGLDAGQTRRRSHKHLQCTAAHAQLHHGQQSTYASKCKESLREDVKI